MPTTTDFVPVQPNQTSEKAATQPTNLAPLQQLEVDKDLRKKLRNRESALLARERKKQKLLNLEKKIEILEEENLALREFIHEIGRGEEEVQLYLENRLGTKESKRDDRLRECVTCNCNRQKSKTNDMKTSEPETQPTSPINFDQEPIIKVDQFQAEAIRKEFSFNTNEFEEELRKLSGKEVEILNFDEGNDEHADNLNNSSSGISDVRSSTPEVPVRQVKVKKVKNGKRKSQKSEKSKFSKKSKSNQELQAPQSELTQTVTYQNLEVRNNPVITHQIQPTVHSFISPVLPGIYSFQQPGPNGHNTAHNHAHNVSHVHGHAQIIYDQHQPQNLNLTQNNYQNIHIQNISQQNFNQNVYAMQPSSSVVQRAQQINCDLMRSEGFSELAVVSEEDVYKLTSMR